MKSIRVAAISFCATEDKANNVALAMDYVDKAINYGAQWIQLPEVFTYNGGPYEKLAENAESLDGPTISQLREKAKRHKVVIFAGSLAEKVEPGQTGQAKVYNTSCVIDRNGEIIAKYRKIHLFNLYSTSGTKLYCESDGYLSGDKFSACQVDSLTVGLSICYDLRFPELYLELQRRYGLLDVIMVPAAFTLGTGMYHWETLLRARAIEHQAYVIAANQVGTHAPGKSSYGHSLIIDPWGDVLASTGSEPGVACADLKFDRIAEARSRIPSLQNKRPELLTRS